MDENVQGIAVKSRRACGPGSVRSLPRELHASVAPRVSVVAAALFLSIPASGCCSLIYYAEDTAMLIHINIQSISRWFLWSWAWAGRMPWLVDRRPRRLCLTVRLLHPRMQSDAEIQLR